MKMIEKSNSYEDFTWTVMVNMKNTVQFPAETDGYLFIYLGKQ